MIFFGLVLTSIIDQRVPLLLETSTKLAETKSWYGTTYRIANYHWLDSNRVLYMTKNSDQSTTFHTMNVKSKEVRESGFTPIFNRSKGMVDTIRVSPDGKKLLWSGWDGIQSKWFVSEVDGANLVGFDRRKISMVISNHGPDDETSLTWGPDGQTIYESIVEFGNGISTRLWSRSVTSIDKEQKLPIAKGTVDWQPEIIETNFAFANSGLAIGSEKPSARFITWNINDPQKTRKEWVVTAPRNRTIGSFSHSHDGKKILWNLPVHDPKATDSWSTIGEEIWLTDAHGKNWKRVARMPFGGKTSFEQSAKLSAARWQPGSKAFSYIYNSNLYQFKLP